MNAPAVGMKLPRLLLIDSNVFFDNLLDAADR